MFAYRTPICVKVVLNYNRTRSRSSKSKMHPAYPLVDIFANFHFLFDDSARGGTRECTSGHEKRAALGMRKLAATPLGRDTKMFWIGRDRTAARKFDCRLSDL